MSAPTEHPAPAPVVIPHWEIVANMPGDELIVLCTSLGLPLTDNSGTPLSERTLISNIYEFESPYTKPPRTPWSTAKEAFTAGMTCTLLELHTWTHERISATAKAKCISRNIAPGKRLRTTLELVTAILANDQSPRLLAKAAKRTHFAETYPPPYTRESLSAMNRGIVRGIATTYGIPLSPGTKAHLIPKILTAYDYVVNVESGFTCKIAPQFTEAELARKLARISADNKYMASVDHTRPDLTVMSVHRLRQICFARKLPGYGLSQRKMINSIRTSLKKERRRRANRRAMRQADRPTDRQ